MTTPDEFRAMAINAVTPLADQYAMVWALVSQKDATIAGLEAQNTEMHNTNVQVINENIALRNEVARLKELTSDVDAPIPEKKPLIGISNGPKIDGACDRWFDGGKGLLLPAPRRAKTLCPRVHASWKVVGDPDPTKDLIIKAFANLLDGDKVEVEHEADVKYRKDVKNFGVAAATANLTERIRLKNFFYDQVKALREADLIPNLNVVATWSAWSFQSNGPKDAVNYLCKGDVLGVDLDGDDSDVGPGDGYYDYSDVTLLRAITTFADAYFNGRWTAPEHGWNNTNVGERVSHFKRTIPAIAAFGPEEIQIFDASGFSPLLTASELTELVPLVRQYNT